MIKDPVNEMKYKQRIFRGGKSSRRNITPPWQSIDYKHKSVGFRVRKAVQK